MLSQFYKIRNNLFMYEIVDYFHLRVHGRILREHITYVVNIFFMNSKSSIRFSWKISSASCHREDMSSRKTAELLIFCQIYFRVPIIEPYFGIHRSFILNLGIDKIFTGVVLVIYKSQNLQAWSWSFTRVGIYRHGPGHLQESEFTDMVLVIYKSRNLQAWSWSFTGVGIYRRGPGHFHESQFTGVVLVIYRSQYLQAWYWSFPQVTIYRRGPGHFHESQFTGVVLAISTSHNLQAWSWPFP